MDYRYSVRVCEFCICFLDAQYDIPLLHHYVLQQQIAQHWELKLYQCKLLKITIY